MTRKQMEELRQDMLDEARQDEIEECRLRRDYDYIMEKVFEDFELQDAYIQFEKASKFLAEYDWEMPPKALFEEI